MKPAPASSTSVSTTSATINAPVQRLARMPPVPLRPPPSFITSLTSVLETWSAGARPKTNAVATHTPARNTITMGSTVNFIQYGLPWSVSTESKIRMPASARPIPSAPLIIDSRTLSTSNWRTIRQRLAPSDTRTAISRVRCADRASSRFATLAQAIRRTNPTAPISDQKINTICGPVTLSL